jgi:hypothetical protein
MSDKIDNPNLDIPLNEGQMSEGNEVNDDLELERLAAEIKSRATKEPVKKKEVVKEVVEEAPSEPTEEETQEEIDARFKGKQVQDVIEMYKNLENLHKSHTNELGELRKTVKELKDKEEQISQLSMTEVEKQIMPKIQSWTAEKKAAFFEKFNNSPEEALAEVIDEVTKPLKRKVAIDVNREEINRLKDLYKEQVVPYVEKDINALIAANPGWWKNYGVGIFDHAYNTYRNKNFDKYAAIREQTIQSKLKEETSAEDDIKEMTFVEGQRPTKIVKKAKEITTEDINAADDDVALQTITKELKKRGAWKE